MFIWIKYYSWSICEQQLKFYIEVSLTEIVKVLIPFNYKGV